MLRQQPCRVSLSLDAFRAARNGLHPIRISASFMRDHERRHAVGLPSSKARPAGRLRRCDLVTSEKLRRMAPSRWQGWRQGHPATDRVGMKPGWAGGAPKSHVQRSRPISLRAAAEAMRQQILIDRDRRKTIPNHGGGTTERGWEGFELAANRLMTSTVLWMKPSKSCPGAYPLQRTCVSFGMVPACPMRSRRRIGNFRFPRQELLDFSHLASFTKSKANSLKFLSCSGCLSPRILVPLNMRHHSE